MGTVFLFKRPWFKSFSMTLPVITSLAYQENILTHFYDNILFDFQSMIENIDKKYGRFSSGSLIEALKTKKTGPVPLQCPRRDRCKQPYNNMQRGFFHVLNPQHQDQNEATWPFLNRCT